MTYAKLLNTRQEFDKNNFVSSLYITEKYNLLNRDNNLLGRNIRLSDVSTKSLIENLPNLKYIMTSGMRNKSIDLETTKKSGLPFY